MTSLVRYEQAYALTRWEWVAAARKLFVSGERQPCVVCGKFSSLTHAHHVVPLSTQAQRDRMVVNHEHEWLCPTHHAAVHVLIGQSQSVAGKASAACLNLCTDLDVDELRAVLAIAERSWK